MIRLRVHAGPHSRRCFPLEVDLDLEPAQPVILYQEPGHRPRACQLEPMPTGSRLRWMGTRLDAKTSQNYRLDLVSHRRKPANRLVWQALDQDQYQVALRGQPVAVCDIGPSRVFSALGSLHAPGKKPPELIVEELWIGGSLSPWTHVRTNRKLLSPPADGPVFGRLRTQGFWLGPAEERLLEEFVTFTFHSTPADLRLMDVTISLRASAGPVKFGGEATSGLLHLRLARAIHSSTSATVMNAVGGIGQSECNGRRAAWWWVNSGSGVAVFDHPDNPGSPCRWHFDDQGVLHADPFGALGFLSSMLPQRAATLPVGEVLTFRYCLLLHGEQMTAAGVRHHYLNFAFPPRVERLE